MLNIRAANISDADDIWRILEPIFRAGETYTIPRDITREEAISYWFATGNQVFVAEEDGDVLGTYYLRAKSAGWRCPRVQLRIHDGSSCYRSWYRQSDVYPLQRSGEEFRLPGDAI